MVTNNKYLISETLTNSYQRNRRIIKRRIIKMFIKKDYKIIRLKFLEYFHVTYAYKYDIADRTT